MVAIVLLLGHVEFVNLSWVNTFGRETMDIVFLVFCLYGGGLSLPDWKKNKVVRFVFFLLLSFPISNSEST